MTTQQLQVLEAELAERGYRKWTRCLTSTESWSWFKTFEKEENEDGCVVSGYQIAFRVWDNSEACRRYSLDEESMYGFDFWTSPIGTGGRMDCTSNWEPICDFDTFEAMAKEFHDLSRKYIDK